MPQSVAHQARLLIALSAEQNRLAMWIARGDPMRLHRELLGLYRTVLELAAKHDIEYWLDFGSLLGYVRHRGMIPWEWDMDIGCRPEHFARWRALAAELDADPSSLYGIRYYEDADYATPGLCVFLRSNPDVLCDITEYRQTDDGRLVCTTADWNYPEHRVAEVFPLQRVALLGCPALIPRDAVGYLTGVESVLGQCSAAGPAAPVLNTIRFTQYDPVPFLLCQMYHPGRCEIVCGAPVVDLPEVATLEQGWAHHMHTGFVVRGLGAVVDCPRSKLEMVARGTDARTFGWDLATLERVDGLSVVAELEAWSDGQARPYALIDATIPGLVADDAITPALRRVGVSGENLMIALSRAGQYTPFHTDSPLSGGGWVWLTQGRKTWTFVDFEHIDRLYDPSSGILRDPPMEDLLYEGNLGLWGRIKQVIQNPGDFVYFPPSCVHRVSTHEASFGYCGYAHTDAWDYTAIREWYRAHGLSATDGIYRR